MRVREVIVYVLSGTYLYTFSNINFHKLKSHFLKSNLENN